MSFRRRLDASTLRTGLVVSLNGLSLWFLAVLVDVYSSEAGLPWRTARGVGLGLVGHTRGWLVEPGLSIPELAGYLGLVLFVTGPVVAVVGRQTARRIRRAE